MSRIYDRKGQPIDDAEWYRLHSDFSYRVIEQTTLPDGTFVSTVWLGLDHHFGREPPFIFETMVFPNKDSRNDRECRRYSTEEDARAGHAEMVERWKR